MRKVLLLEINEITWDLINPLIAQGKLPNFQRLKTEGTWGTTISVDLPPQMDPWVTWTTIYTGQPQSEHNVFFLQQPPDTIHAKRIWQRCHEQGLKVGVYGSLCTWPPQPVKGFYVPDTFAPDPDTYPAELRSIQVMNLTYTRSVRLPADQDTLRFKARLARDLVRLGLSPATMLRIAKQLAAERLDPSVRWRRVALQPYVNFTFFERLYHRHRPDFATFHTNHVAHYMHTYWKAMEPDKFKPLETSEQERDVYGGAIEYGYVTADELVGRALKLIDKDTVLVMASSMGQKPFRSTLEGGKAIAQWRSLNQLLDILNARGTARAVSTMSDEFVIYAADAERDRILGILESSYIDVPERKTFFCSVIEGAVRVNLLPHEIRLIKPDSQVHFPQAPGTPVFRHDEVIYSTGHLKSGCHDERGVLAFYGAGIAAGQQLGMYDTLSIAPTLMQVLGLPIPAEMRSAPIVEILDRLAA